jgi:hypothetical protein
MDGVELVEKLELVGGEFFVSSRLLLGRLEAAIQQVD